MSAVVYPDPATRSFITASVILSTTMVAIDGTIANVALPHMQSSVSASFEQIVWVLTSYIIGSAIATPLSGWLANRYGRKRVMLGSIVGFTLMSIACGLSVNLFELVLFRFLQGVFGASMIPLSQSTLLDINPPERHGQAMAIYSMGVVMGPILGPVLGGYLTEALNWRWIFFINVPIGILALAGVTIFMSESKAETPSRFDIMGFASLSIFLASFQLMLDRGQQLDWFSATEICIYAALAAVFAYVTVVHMVTARQPFVRLGVFSDRNFSTAMVISMLVGVLVYAPPALLAPMLQQLMGYPATTAGLVSAPRGIGTVIAIYVVGRLVGRVDPRYPLFFGLLLSLVSLYDMSHFSLELDEYAVLSSGFLQGMSVGFVSMPMTTIMFSTLKPQYRNEGAALNALFRNMGAAIGLSYVQSLTYRNSQTVQSRLVESVRPDNPALAIQSPDFDFTSSQSVARMMAEIGRQAQMVAYIDSFWAIFVMTVVAMPLVFLMRRPVRKPGADEPPVPILD